MDIRKSRSPSKTRDFPRNYGGLETSEQHKGSRLRMLADAVGGVDFANHAAESLSRTFVANATTKAAAPFVRREECCNESAVEMKNKVSDGVMFSKRNVMDDESMGLSAGEYWRKNCDVEHVVPRDDEKYMKSESLESDTKTKRKFSVSSEFCAAVDNEVEEVKRRKVISVKDQMFEIFQPWALKTYGDQAKTKTITARKKNRILKALDGKEHSKPDSSKFRFWVKSKGFTTQRPKSFVDISESKINEVTIRKDHIELYVASTVKVFGETVYRKVAVVEDFFEIIYNVHVEQGGRNGRHAGQKRTYRIITETYAFLPREAVTKFLGSCPSCMRNLRSGSPGHVDEACSKETSSEYEALNYSSPNDSSVDSSSLGIGKPYRRKAEGKISPLILGTFHANLVTKSQSFQKTHNLELIRNSNISSVGSVLSKNIESSKGRSSTVVSPLVEGPRIGNVRECEGNSTHSEKFKIKNLLKVEGKSERKSPFREISSSSGPIKTESDTIRDPVPVTDWAPYETTRPSGYFRESFIANTYIPTARKYMKSTSLNLETPNFNTTLDLTLKKKANVSINIDSNWPENLTKLKLSTEHTYNPSNEGDTKTVDVLINISNSNNNSENSYQPYQSRGSNLCRPNDKNSHEVFSLSSSPCFLDNNNGCKLEECAINLSKKSRNEVVKKTISTKGPSSTSGEEFPVDLSKVKPITSTYLQMTRSFGLSDHDALRFDNLVSKDFRYTL